MKHNNHTSAEDIQPRIFDDADLGVTANEEASGPVSCLGRTFANDGERREYFRAELRKKLPELRHIEGFPIGEDDDIIALSDPPYYTACPNPWLNDFIAKWESEKADLEAKGLRDPNFKVSEPYAADVSEGKTNPIYMAHAYHTKVPHPAIMRYILHYTQPGDIVFDGFAGTGMTGVAAGKCAERNDITKNKTIGLRHCICSDLSPIASFICYNFNHQCEGKALFANAKKAIAKVKKSHGHLYNVRVDDNNSVPMSYVIWSECMSCPSCGTDILFYKDAFDPSGERTDFKCPTCGIKICKKNLERCFETTSSNSGEIVTRVKLAPAAVRYKFNKKWIERELDESELNSLTELNSVPVNENMPILEIPAGFNTNQILRTGRHNVCDLYTKRNLIIFSELWKESRSNPLLKFAITAILVKTGSILHNVGFKKGKINLAGALPNVLYIPSILAERNIFDLLEGKIKDLEKINPENLHQIATQVQSATDLSNIGCNTVDYIFTDPPFGSNIMYSDLNFIHEAWMHVVTNSKEEAIQNPNQNKSLSNYQDLMTKAFEEFYRVLKPNHWMTVEFSNTSAAVWNAIQYSLSKAGFTVTSVSALDKQQGSYKCQTTTTAVKQDLVISCYKPSEELSAKFLASSDTRLNVWDFVEELLLHLPVHLKKDNSTTAVVERSPKILFDRTIAYYVQHSYPVPMNASEFQKGLHERFVERDGMYFTAEQAVDYDEKRAKTATFEASSLFVGSEAEGVEWLKRELDTPKTYQELQPEWMQALVGTRKGDSLPELKVILEENFLQDDDGRWRKPDSEKEADLEKIRNRRLAHEFKTYVEVASKPKGKIKEARLEALRYGFKECYREKDFQTIVTVANRLPEALLMEDEQLLQYYDIAINRI